MDFLVVGLCIIILFLYYQVQLRELRLKITNLEDMMHVLQSKKWDTKLENTVDKGSAAISRPVTKQNQQKPSDSNSTSNLTHEQASQGNSEWEIIIGGKWLNRIGAVALVIGLGFFIKYAFDKNWLNETVRVIFGFILGCLLTWAGCYSYRKKIPVFGQGLMGAGISSLYLSVFAAFSFYHLISLPIASVLMFGIIISAFWLATKFNSLAIALLSWVGSYLSPVLLYSVKGGPGVYLYLSILTLGILLMCVKKSKWIILYFLTFLADYISYFAWSSSNKDVLNIGFISFMWAVFFIFEIYLDCSKNSVVRQAKLIGAILNIILYYSALMLLLQNVSGIWLAIISLGIGLVYLIPVIYSYLRKQLNQVEPLTIGLYVVTFLFFLTIAQQHVWTQFELVTSWSIEVLILMRLGSKNRVPVLYYFAFMLAIVDVASLIERGLLVEKPHVWLLNSQTLAYFTLATTLGLSAVWLRKSKEQNASLLSQILHVGWCLLVLIWLSIEVDLFFAHNSVTGQYEMYHLVLSLTWLIYSLILFTIGYFKVDQLLRYISISLFGLSILKIFVIDLSNLGTLYRIFSFVGLGVILLFVSFLYQKKIRK